MVRVARAAPAAALLALVVTVTGVTACATSPPPAAPLPDGTPREVIDVVGDPCALLTDDQADDLGLDDPEPRQTPATVTCSWTIDDWGQPPLTLDATALPQSEPLAFNERIADPEGAGERTSVAGLPAVLVPRSRLGAGCELGILVGPGRTVELYLFGEGAQDDPSCDLVRRAAPLMVAGLPPVP